MISRVKQQYGYLCLAIALLAVALTTSCVISPRRVPGVSAQPALGQIYVSNNATNQILRFSNAPNANGDVTPAATISGSQTLLDGPEYLLIDASADRLFVSNAGGGQILIFEKASTRNGDSAPDRTIGGITTGLTSPVDLELDAGRNQLYVADGSAVLVFDSASTINGDVAPVRSIALGFVVGAILVDAASDRLFAVNAASNAVAIYDNAHLLAHTVTPNRLISGPNASLDSPAALALDASGRLVVTNRAGASIAIFANASSANGNIAPISVLNGSKTGMGSPGQMVFRNQPANGEVYLADGAAAGVLVFSDFETLSGNTAPARIITGDKTGLARSSAGTGPPTTSGIAVDMSR